MSVVESERPDELDTRRSLLIRIRHRKDTEAWSEFVSVYEPVIYQMARRRGVQDADAREIVQEVLLSVASAIDRFDVDAKGSFRGWLSRVTRNLTIDRLRQANRRAERLDASGLVRHLDAIASERSTDEELAEEFDQDRRRQLFHWAAGQVREKTGEQNWIAFWNTSVEGTGITATAQELGISEGAVYVARCRVLKRIRELVQQRLEE